VPVYDLYAYTSPRELIGEHQTCRTCAHDQNIRIHLAHLEQNNPAAPYQQAIAS
jgi:hypothetical protein